jgi:hypothetical protein
MGSIAAMVANVTTSVEVPRGRRLRPQPPKIAGEGRPKPHHPATDGFERGLDAALGQELLDVAVAQREAQVKPNGVPDDLGQELVAGIGDWLHPATLPTIVCGRPPSRDNALRAILTQTA